MKAPKYIANFDSATAMLRATSRYLRGEDFPALGVFPEALEPAVRLLGAHINALPRRLREGVYTYGGWNEAIRPDELGSVSAEEVAR